MIFRKPYAFFIKYFRLINLIMAAFMAVLIYRSFKVGNYINDYISDYVSATDGFVLSNYINFYVFLLTLLVVVLTIVVMSVMIVKDKPKKLYIFNLFVYIALIVIYGLDYSILSTIRDNILDVRVSKAIRDVTFIALGMQVISFLATLVRATGFDIKGFDFGKDLQQLEIDVKDNEEFEVAVNFDQNKVKRGIRGKLRITKYFYVEHKFIINLTVGIAAIVIAFIVFMFKIIYTDTHGENKIFTASMLQFNVTSSYVTKADQNGDEIVPDDKALVVVKLDVRKLTEDKKSLNTGLTTLRIGNRSYGRTNDYNESLSDIGVPYVNQRLSTEFTNYILIFEIPTEQMNRPMKLKINDSVSYIRGEIGAKNIFVNLKPLNLIEKNKTQNYNLKDTVIFTGSILGNSELSIDEYSVANKFKVEYNFCSKKDKCVTSYEYVTPTASGAYFKTLLRLDGEFDEDEDAGLDNLDDLYYFLNEFGSVHYQVDGTWYDHKINSKLVKPKIGKDGNYYIEVNKNVEKASSIYLKFDVRNFSYKYVLK